MESFFEKKFDEINKSLDDLNKRFDLFEKILSSMTTSKSDNDFIKISEAARVISQKTTYVYRLVATNAIPFFRMGRSIRFSKSELDIWMRSGRPSIQQDAINQMTDNYANNSDLMNEIYINSTIPKRRNYSQRIKETEEIDLQPFISVSHRDEVNGRRVH